MSRLGTIARRTFLTLALAVVPAAYASRAFAVDALPDEVIDAEIAHIDDEALDHGRDIDEGRRHRGLPLRGNGRRQEREGEGRCGGGAHRKTQRRFAIMVLVAAIQPLMFA